MHSSKKESFDFKKNQSLYLVGMTGFEPATTRPPAVYANRTAPHPDFKMVPKENTFLENKKAKAFKTLAFLVMFKS